MIEYNGGGLGRPTSTFTIPGVDSHGMALLISAGYTSADQVRAASDDDLLAIDGIGPKTVEVIRNAEPGDQA